MRVRRHKENSIHTTLKRARAHLIISSIEMGNASCHVVPCRGIQSRSIYIEQSVLNAIDRYALDCCVWNWYASKWFAYEIPPIKPANKQTNQSNRDLRWTKFPIYWLIEKKEEKTRNIRSLFQLFALYFMNVEKFQLSSPANIIHLHALVNNEFYATHWIFLMKNENKN